jgi:uncharacterized metal-binding protein
LLGFEESSNVAQLSNDIALVIDTKGHSEVYCVAGYTGEIQLMVSFAGRRENLF